MAKFLAVLASCLLLAHEVILQGTARQQGITTPYNNIQVKNESLADPAEQDNHLQLVSSAPIRIQATASNAGQPLNFTTTGDDSTKPPTVTPATPVTTARDSNPHATFQQSTDSHAALLPTTTVPPATQQTTTVPSSTTLFTTRLPPIPTTGGSTLPQKTTFTPSSTRTTFSSMSTTFVPSTVSATASPPAPTTRPTNKHIVDIRSGVEGPNRLQRCPRAEDIHPCECVEVATPSAPEGGSESNYRSEYEVETVAFCKNIRNEDVLRDALKGMQGRHMTYLVLDSVHLPPFPNDLLKNVGVGWMEVLNSTMQFRQEFFQCYDRGCV